MKKIATLLILTLFSFSGFSTPPVGTWYYQSGDAAIESNWNDDAAGAGTVGSAGIFSDPAVTFDLNGKASIIVSTGWTLAGTLVNPGIDLSIFNVSNTSTIVFNGDVQDGDNMTCTPCASVNYHYTIDPVDIIPGTYDNALVIRDGVTGIAMGNITAADVETTNSASVLDMASFTLTVNSVNLVSGNNGTIKTQNTSSTPITLSSGTWKEKIVFNATGAQTVPAGTYEDLTITGSGTKTTGGALTVNGVLSLTKANASPLLLNLEDALTGTFTTAAGDGVLILNTNTTAGDLPSGKTWNFNVSSEQSGYVLPELTMNNSILDIRENTSLSGAVTLTGTGRILFHGSGKVLDCVTFPINCNNNQAIGAFDTDGKIQTQASTGALTGSILFGDKVVVEFNAAGAQEVPGGTYRGGITASTSGTKTFTGTVNMAGTLTCASNVVIDANTFPLTIDFGTLTIAGNGTFYTSNISNAPVPTSLDWSSLLEFEYRAGTTKMMAGTYSDLILNGNGTRTTEGNINCDYFYLTTSNEVAQIAPGHFIECSTEANIIASGSSIVLQADVSGYGQLKTPSYVGAGSVEKQYYFAPATGRWNNIGTGLVGANLTDIADADANFNFSPFAANGDGSAFKWNATNSNWETADATGNSPWNGVNVFSGPGKTGSVFMTKTGTVSLSGAPYLGDPVIGLSYDNGASSNTTQTAGVGSADWGWNFIANPYTSSYDWDLQAIPTNVYNAIYIWTGSNYATYVKGAGTGNNGGTQYIAPAQGFWVQTNANLLGGTANLTLALANTTVVATPSYFKTDPDGIKLNLADSNPEHTDQLTIVFNHQATNGFDGKYDAHKLLNLGDVPNIWTQSEAHGYSINSSPNSVDRFSVHVADKNENEQMTFSLEDENLQSFNYVFIEDLKTNTFKELSNSGTYSFIHDVNFGTERFQLHFGKTQHEILARVENRLKAYFSSEALVLNLQSTSLSDVDITLTDLQGRTIVNERRAFASEISIENLPKLSIGVYLLSVSQKGQNLGVMKIMR